MAQSATTLKNKQLAELADTVREQLESGAPDQVEGSPGLAERVEAGRIRQLVEDNPAARRGPETSEWKLTLASWVVGAVVFLVGLFAPGIPTEALREVLVWVAGLLVGGSGIAYTAARTSLKRRLADLVGL